MTWSWPPCPSLATSVGRPLIFTRDVSAALGGPAWLSERRAAAWDRFAAGSLPSEAEELWRYSGINAFELDRFAPTPPGAVASERARVLSVARSAADALGPRAALVVTLGGSVVAAEVSDAAPGEGLSVRSTSPVTDATGGPLDAGAATGFGLADAQDAFASLHEAFVGDVVHVAIAAKGSVRDPVVVVHFAGGAGTAGGSAFPHLVVEVGSAGEGGVIELLVADDPPSASPGGGASLVLPVVELDVADGARLSYANLQVLDGRCTQIAHQASRVGRDGALRSFSLGLGSAYARVRTDSLLHGQGATSSILAAYLGTGTQVLDFRTLQDHAAAHTESELLFKGAVADTARSVYSGLIRIRNGARKSNAFQTNHNLVLSDGAHADSVPNLDILENDVRCSHASTVGPIDEEQRWYLESRGVGPEAAEGLVVSGFFRDLAGRAPWPGVGAWVEHAVAGRLGRHFGGSAGAGHDG